MKKRILALWLLVSMILTSTLPVFAVNELDAKVIYDIESVEITYDTAPLYKEIEEDPIELAWMNLMKL